MQLNQLALFDLPAPSEDETRALRRPRFRRDREEPRKLPVQVELRLKWARKIAFKRRFREDPDATNDYHWSIEAIVRLHQELFRDWEDRFPAVSLRSEVLDYWSWMLADSAAPFSFRDVLLVNGYRDPDAFIEAAARIAPDWVLDELRKQTTTA